jgi:hypothetical protein
MQKVQKLRRKALPNYKDVDSVMQWLDGQGRPGQVGLIESQADSLGVQMVQWAH